MLSGEANWWDQAVHCRLWHLQRCCPWIPPELHELAFVERELAGNWRFVAVFGFALAACTRPGLIPQLTGESCIIFQKQKKAQATLTCELGRMCKGSMAFCSVCGAYFWRRVGSLAAPCRGHAIGAQAKRIASGLFPAAGARYCDHRVSDIRSPSPAELLEISRQVQSAGTAQVQVGIGAAVPRRRLRAKTGPAARQQALLCEVRSAFGLADESLFRQLLADRKPSSEAGDTSSGESDA